MSDQLYILKWNCHGQTLNQNLPYFLENDILTDVTLSVGTQHVKAHKVILAMCSVYFLQLFQEIQSSHPVVFLHSVSFDEVKAILSFMYNGQCIVSEDQLPSVLSVAKLLKVQGLCDMKVPDRQCRNEISTNLINKIDINELRNNESFLPHDYSTNCRHREDIDTKNQKEENISMYELKNNNNNSSNTTNYTASENIIPQNKTAIVKEQMAPLKLGEEPFTFPAERFQPKEPLGTCKCFLCGKYLSNQYNLRVHMETHEEAFHACQSCPHVSRSRDALRKHVSYRHPEEYHNRKRKKQ